MSSIPQMPQPGEPLPDSRVWFEQMYAAAEHGDGSIPWDRQAPAPLLVRWAQQHPEFDRAGKRALVVGCGLGDDAEFIFGLGYQTLGFDVSESAIRAAHQRFPATGVTYRVADLLDLPAEWAGAFDFVWESRTVQAMPDPPRNAAIPAIASCVAPGGRLLVMAAARDDDEPDEGPPFPLPRATIESFATKENGLELVEIVRDTLGAGGPEQSYWLAEFRRNG